MYELAIFAIIVVLVFDFINGFHDAANAIATVVATKVLTPIQAVSMAAVGNLIGPLFFSVAIAKTVGKGIVQTDIVTIQLILAALGGAIIWDLITWYAGLPVSSSHALIGGLVGAATAAAGPGMVIGSGVLKVVVFMVVAPVIGMVTAFMFTLLVLRAFRKYTPSRVNSYFKRLQLVSAFMYSVTHGTNDAQKGMGIITLILFTEGLIPSFEVPLMVILAAHIAISLGTFFGGWRIVRTMATRITKLRPYQGFCAETGGGIALVGTAIFGIPVSTTHVISAAIMGVGATEKLSAVRWGIARNIIWAWILTIPISAVMAGGAYFVISRF